MSDQSDGTEPTPPEPLIVPMSDPPQPFGEPTQVIPAAPTSPTLPPADPTMVAPLVAAGGGPGGPGGPIDPPPPTDTPWYEDPRGRAALIGGGLAFLLLLIVGLIWWAGDDGDDDAVVIGSSTSISSSLPSTSVASSSSVPTTSTTTTLPASSSSAPSTSTTTTTTTTTIEATTTVAATTTAAPTTTVAPTTQAPTTTLAPTTTTTVAPPPVPVITNPPAGESLLYVVQNTPDLSRLRQLVADSDFASELDAPEVRTFFALSNSAIDAYAATPAGAAVLADPAKVHALLLDHLVLSEHKIPALWSESQLDTAGDDTVTVNGSNETVGGATVTVENITAANGVLHAVSSVLVVDP